MYYKQASEHVMAEEDGETMATLKTLSERDSFHNLYEIRYLY